MPGFKAIYPVAAAVLITACASAPPPREAIGDAEAAVERARDAQARQFAAFELEQAERKVERARSLSNGSSEENIEARRLAEQAALDAQLAEEKALLARARATYNELRRAVDGEGQARPADEEGGAQ